MRSRMVGMVWRTLVALLIVGALSQGAFAQMLILDDPLTNSSTLGTRGGSIGTQGTFIPGEGWKVTYYQDCIYWHLPQSVSRGRVEFCVKGLKSNTGGELDWNTPPYVYPFWDKSEIFHMYDNTWYNADNSYAPGYRDDWYKMYIRKIGPWDKTNPNTDGKMGRCELVWQIRPDGMEPDSQVLSWSSSETYKFRVDWAPNGRGETIETISRYRASDGYTTPDVLSTSPSLWCGGYWSPGGHSIRIGASTRRETYNGYPCSGAADGAIYSNMKVWQYVPIAPIVTLPIKSVNYNTLNAIVRWVGEPHTAYEVHVNTSNDANTGIVWDSGQVTSTGSQVTTGTLANLTNYYVFVRMANQAGWGDWSAAGYWFRTDTSYVFPRTGVVSVNNYCLRDNSGDFLGLGATYMRGMQRCKYDRQHYESDLSCLAANGFNYIRILTMVGWDGLEIAPLAIDKGGWWVDAWPDYDQQLKDAIDIAYDKYRIRTQITVFADAQNCMPNSLDRTAHMDRILADLVGREHKVIMIEVANEYWQNGLTRDEVRTDGCYLAARTSIPVSLSSLAGESDAEPLYCNGYTCADIATIHFDRDVNTAACGWWPVVDPWRYLIDHPCLPPMSSNEPCGPGYLSYGDDQKITPITLSSAATFAWIAKLPMYVYHSRPGVDAKIRWGLGYPGEGEAICFPESRGVDSYRYLTEILPGDLPNWTRNDGKETSAPFTVSRFWTSCTDPGSGLYWNAGAIKGKQFVCYPMGILPGGVTLTARRDVSLTVYNPLTGAVVDTRTLNTGYSISLAQGPGAYIIKGTFPGSDTSIPGSPIHFAANPGDGQNTLTWRNPSDADFLGTKIVFRTDRYPTTVTDGTLVCDRVSSPGAKYQYTHTGLTNGVRCYYSAFAYDDNITPGPNYSPPATAIGKPVAGQCFSERFTYPNGNVVGNRSWTGAATSEIAVLSDAVKITGGIDTKEAVHLVSCSGSGGIIDAYVHVKSGSGTNTMWGLWFDDPSGNNLARWYGWGTTAKPRIGATGTVLPQVTLTGGWDLLRVRINTSANTSEFFFNEASLGTLSHVETGAGDSIGRVKLERIGNGSSTPSEFINLDNIVIGPAALDNTAPGPVTNFVADNQPTQVNLSWSNPGDADYAGTRIVYKADSAPSDPWDGTRLYDGTGTNYMHTNPPGGITWYAAYAYDGAMNFSSAALASVNRGVQDCFSDAFSYPNGNLNGNGTWSGSATTQILVEDGGVKVVGGATAYDAAQVVSCAGSGGVVCLRMKVKKGMGTHTLWNLYVDDSAGKNLARWYGMGTSARGRIGAGSQVTTSKTLTGTSVWDDLYLRIDFAANTSQFFFNGTSVGTLDHSEFGAGDSIGRLRFERENNPSGAGEYVYLDDLVAGGCDVTAPTATIGSPSIPITKTIPVSYTVNFSETVYGFSSSADVQLNSTGGATAGSVVVTGSGSGPYTVSLSSISGNGTLGITVKSAAANDVAGIGNTVSSASTTFKVVGTDGRISDVKDDGNGTPVLLGGKALYLRQTGFGYIEELDRTMGIRVEGALAGSVGDLVVLSGVMGTEPGGERYVVVDAMAGCGTGSVDPLGLSNRALIEDLVRGLYVKVWGKVKPGSITGNSYFLTDGSDETGIKVITPGAPGVSENEFVTVVGAAGSDGARVVYKR